ncbi:MAG TPA: hypothetical protein VF692_14755 [Pyrinomonadaceae bacterium]|jgi:hypothetical protein
MNNNKKSDLLDTTDAKTLSDRDKEALKSAPHSGNSPNPTGIAGTVMSDESYINRDENSEFNSDLPTDSGVINQTIKPDEIDASSSSD